MCDTELSTCKSYRWYGFLHIKDTSVLFYFPTFIVIAYLPLLFVVFQGGGDRNKLMIRYWKGELLRGGDKTLVLRTLPDTQ